MFKKSSVRINLDGITKKILDKICIFLCVNVFSLKSNVVETAIISVNNLKEVKKLIRNYIEWSNFDLICKFYKKIIVVI